MNEELKPFIIKSAIVAGGILGVAGVFYGVSSYHEYAKVERHKQAQATIRQMISFCGFSHLKDEEQSQINNCGDDVEAVRSQLKRIIAERTIFWRASIEDVAGRVIKLKKYKEDHTYWSASIEETYQEVLGKLIKEGKQALEQLEYWTKKSKDLDTWKPGNNSNNLLDEQPTKKPSTTLT